MFSTTKWYYFINALDKNTCDKIRNAAEGKWSESSVDTQKDIIDKKVRISDVVWTSDQWIYDTIWPYMEESNEQAGWKYDIRGAEAMQITRYKKGGFYYFHKDGKGDHLSAYDMPDNKHVHGHVRKLSMTILLNDNYEGGEFQFATYEKEKCKIEIPEFNKIGSIVVFPSDMEHRVAPVTKGIRYSLVTWFVGPPFK
jgi:PKHD-type hydroxylase